LPKKKGGVSETSFRKGNQKKEELKKNGPGNLRPAKVKKKSPYTVEELDFVMVLEGVGKKTRKGDEG